MRSVSKSWYCHRLLAVNAIRRLIDHLTESKSNDNSHHGRDCISTACSHCPENAGIQSPENVQLHAPPSSIEVATTAFPKRRDRCEAQEPRFVFQSMGRPSDETIGALMGIREEGARFMCKRARREQRHHHLFWLLGIQVAAADSRVEKVHTTAPNTLPNHERLFA